MGRFTSGLFAAPPAPGPRLFQAVAFAIHLQDMNVVGEAIEQRAGQSFRAEHAGPVLEGQVRGDDGRATLVPLAEHLEQQFRPSLGARSGQALSGPPTQILRGRDAHYWAPPAQIRTSC